MGGKKSGISHGGRSAEERYRLATGAAKTAKAGLGDAVLEGTFIEVKNATSHTLNQVRAVKYIPLVAYHEPKDAWYVVPAHIVVCLVSTKSRGQHTENPFESATLNVSSLAKYKVATEADLKMATLDAIAEAANYPTVKQAMNDILAQSKMLARTSIAVVTDLMAALKIVP